MLNRLTTKVVFFVAFLAAACAPAGAVNRVVANPVPVAVDKSGRASINRVNFAQQQNPSEAQFLAMQRDLRLGLGAYWLSQIGSSPQYADLAVTASGNGLFVQVAPAITNTQGQIYITAPDDTSIFGVGTFALAADPTLIVEQGTITSPPVSVGPLAASVTSGQSVPYLIECTVSDVDQTPITYNFINSQNQVSTASVYFGRNDNGGCAYKAGASSASPTLPAADAGYVGVAGINVPYGATSISGLPITMQTQNQVSQPVQSHGGATIDLNGCFDTGASSLCPGGLTTQSGNFSAALAALSVTSQGNILTNNGQVISASGLPLRLCANATCSSMPYVDTAGNFKAAASVFGTSGGFGGGSYAAPSSQFLVGNDSANSYLRSGTGGIYLQNGAATSTFASFTSAGESVTGSFSTTTSLTAGNTASNEISLNAGFGNIPAIGNASDGGMNFGINSASTLGYRFFKGTTPTGLVTFDMSGNVIAAGGFIAGNGILTSGSGVSSLALCYNNTATCGTLNAYGLTTGSGGFTAQNGVFTASGGTIDLCFNNAATCSSVNQYGVYSNGGFTSSSGVYTASGSSASFCINNSSTCMTYNNGRNNGGDITAGGAVLGTYGTDYAAPIAFGGGTRGETEIGTSAANSVAGVAGEIMRVADCQSNGSGSACNTDARTFFTINNTGQAGFLAGVYAGGPYTQASARALKRDIYLASEDPLKIVASVKAVRYNYRTEKAGTPEHYGLIADDTDSAVSGPRHDGLDVGALAVADAGAINELANRTPQTSQTRDLQNQVSQLRQWLIAAVVFMLLAFAASFSLIAILMKRTAKV